MKRYIEYLELYGYFARQGEPKLPKEDFDSADEEWRDLSARHPDLLPEERAHLVHLKALLYRDKP